MIKKLFTVLTLTLALNFVAAAGGVGWLFASGKLNKEKATAVKELLFPPHAEGPEVVSTTQPSTRPTTGPSKQLDDLLAKYADQPVGDQVEAVRRAIDAQAADLDRRQREMEDLRAQLLREKAELARRTDELAKDRQRFVDQEKQQAAQATDKGFKESLELYLAMPTKNAKTAFMAMTEDEVARYLQAMPPRTAAKIIREFKTPEELARISRAMDRVKAGGGPTTNPAAPAGATAAVPPPPS